MLDELQANLCINPSRIYITGKSNGGGFTNLLACTPSINKRVAAFGTASAALYPAAHPIDNCTPGRGINFLSTHGKADTTIPYAGRTHSSDGAKFTTPDVDNWRKAWASRNGCTNSAATNVTKPYSGTTESVWMCPKAEVVGYEVQGLGHSWPKTQFAATRDVFIPFFQKHSLTR